MKIAVLDIGGTSIKSGIYQDGILNDVKETDTDAAKGGQYVAAKAVEILKGYKGIDGIGISTAGQVDFEKGIIRYANSNIPGYTGMNMKQIFQEAFHVPVSVENDVNAAAIGEANFGAGRAERDFLCLTYGTGIGGAVVIEKEIYKGNCFSAGEFGAMVVHASERTPKIDVFSGCYERYASTTALVKKAMELDPALCSGREIFARLEDRRVLKLVDNWILEIIYGLTSLIHIFNPSCIILGGGIMNQKYILDKLKENLYNHIMESYRDVKLKQAELGNTAGLLGAAQIVLEKGV